MQLPLPSYSGLRMDPISQIPSNQCDRTILGYRNTNRRKQTKVDLKELSQPLSIQTNETVDDYGSNSYHVGSLLLDLRETFCQSIQCLLDSWAFYCSVILYPEDQFILALLNNYVFIDTQGMIYQEGNDR